MVGWKIEKTPVDNHHDFTMTNAITGEAQTAICQSKGLNKDIPGNWLMYVYVDNIEERSKEIEQL